MKPEKQTKLFNKMTKKYFLKTFGCQMNFSDSERIASFLEKLDIQPTNSLEQADLIIFNTCGVRQTAEDRLIGQLRNLRQKNKKAIVAITGCLSHRKDIQKKLQNQAEIFFPIKELFKFPLKIRKIDPDFFEKLPSKRYSSNESYLSIIPKYKKKSQALVPIMTGCNNFCSYCVVPYARGKEKSRPVEEILTEIERLNQKKIRQILLLGQNVNSYHCPVSPKNRYFLKEKTCSFSSGRLSFAQLLNFLAKSFPQIEFNFLTSHPKDFSQDLIETIVQNPNISKKIHLPLQSGSNKVLRDMNRPYTKKGYLNLIQKIKKQIPKVQISTDVIVGFPTETEQDFLETVDVFKKVNVSEAFINKYSPRPQTAALKLGDPISWQEKKRREKILRALL